MGLVAVALLEADNMHDIETDTVAGKRTLAVQLGRRRVGNFYVPRGPGSGLGGHWGLASLERMGPAWASWRFPWRIYPVAQRKISAHRAQDFLPLLGATARLQ